MTPASGTDARRKMQAMVTDRPRQPRRPASRATQRLIFAGRDQLAILTCLPRPHAQGARWRVFGDRPAPCRNITTLS